MNISSSDVSCDYFELRACLFNLRAKVVNKRIKNRHLRSFQAYYLTVLAYTKTIILTSVSVASIGYLPHRFRGSVNIQY